MKRFDNLYESMLDFDKLNETYKLIKNNCKNKNRIVNFSYALNGNLIEILNKLEKECYKFSKYHIFLISKPKYRVIMAENISDKIVNHLVSNYILIPALMPCLIDTNVATRKERGSEYAYNYVVKSLKRLRQETKVYILKIDISKYFYNIDHEILIKKLEKRIKDNRALTIIKHIINTTNEEYINQEMVFLINREKSRLSKANINRNFKEESIKVLEKIPLYHKNKGLPIGNMTSQIMAIFYLNDLDHYIKENLKFKYYIRYMDDLIIMDTNIDKLQEALKKIENFLIKEKLKLNDKCEIINLKKGKLNFLGYTFFYKDNKLKMKYNKKTFKLIKQNLKYLKKYDFNKYLKSKGSYKGYFLKIKTNLYKTNYKIMEVNGMYDKFLEIKKNYSEFVILIKSGRFYRTYDEDAVIISYLLNYNVMENKVGFPIESLFKVKSALKRNKIGYVIFENNELNLTTEENSEYRKILLIADERYNTKLKNQQILKEIEDRLIKDKDFYSILEKFIYN